MLAFSEGERFARKAVAIFSASSLCKAKTSVVSRSNVSAQTCASVRALISCVLIRTRLPERRTVPSRMCATPSAVPISRKLRAPDRYCRTEVRLMTLKIRNLGQVRQNIVLHAIGEVGVLLIVAEIFKRKHGDAFLRDLC